MLQFLATDSSLSPEFRKVVVNLSGHCRYPNFHFYTSFPYSCSTVLNRTQQNARLRTMNDDVGLDGSKVKELRKQRCWSQDELALAAGISIRTIQRVEKTGSASLETIKALCSVFGVEPSELKNQTEIQSVTFSFIFKYGWLAAFAISSLLFGAWMIDILIPTLKGADFNTQYEIHNNFRYLDLSGISFMVGFIWLGIYVFANHRQQKNLAKKVLVSAID